MPGFVAHLNHHGPVLRLRCCILRPWSFPSPPSWQAAQQPSREFTRADPTTRSEDAGFSICWIGATFSLQALGRLQHIQHLPPSDHSLDASDVEGTCIRHLEDLSGRHHLRQYAPLPCSAPCHQRDKTVGCFVMDVRTRKTDSRRASSSTLWGGASAAHVDGVSPRADQAAPTP